MKRVCSVDSNKCPNCGHDLEIENSKCIYCQIEIRVINKNRIKNPDFLREIAKYNMDGEFESAFKNVYECYPMDTKLEQKKRAKVIEVCNGKANSHCGYQWRFVDDGENVGKLRYAGSSKAVLQVDFEGNIIREFKSIEKATGILNYTVATISKACKRRIPPQNADYFLFFKDDYCGFVFQQAYDKYMSTNVQIEVKNAQGELIGKFDTYKDAADKLGVSASSVSSWCNGKCYPSGEFADFEFRQIGYRENGKYVEDVCPKPGAEICAISLEYNRVQTENSELRKRIKELEEQDKKISEELQVQENKVEELEKHYARRKPKIDQDIKFMMPIEEFISMIEKNEIMAGVCIYILCDENGKRYVGQSNRDDYSRIKEHFNGSSKDAVYEAYQKNTQFYVEQIVIGWEDNIPFNLNDAEAYYINYYDSFDDGYNKTRGNHQENRGKFDKKLILRKLR